MVENWEGVELDEAVEFAREAGDAEYVLERRGVGEMEGRFEMEPDSTSSRHEFLISHSRAIRLICVCLVVGGQNRFSHLKTELAQTS